MKGVRGERRDGRGETGEARRERQDGRGKTGEARRGREGLNPPSSERTRARWIQRLIRIIYSLRYVVGYACACFLAYVLLYWGKEKNKHKALYSWVLSYEKRMLLRLFNGCQGF